jgi:hypothetical protein
MDRSRLSNRTFGPLLLLALSVSAAACGPVSYVSKIRSAEQKLKQARDENARWYAPYEYYFAEAHLRQSEHDAALASYEDAVRYAKIAEDFSTRALEITRRKRQSE